MNEVWNLWRTFLHKIVERLARKYRKYRDFINISIPYFDERFAKKYIYAQRVPHCLTAEHKQKGLEIPALLKQRFNVEGQAFLCRIVGINETWVKDFEPELKSQSNEWRSPTSPRPKKNFDELNQWWALLMITEESSWQSSMWNKFDRSVLSWLDAKTAQKNAQNPTRLARGWATHFARQCTPPPGEGCDRFAK